MSRGRLRKNCGRKKERGWRKRREKEEKALAQNLERERRLEMGYFGVFTK
jgi:predicted secreted protein